MHSKVFAIAHRRFHAHPQLAAIGYGLISCAASSAMSVAVRALANDFHPALIISLRTFVTLILLLPWIWHHGHRALHTTRLRGHVLRGAVGALGMIGWVYSVSILPVTHATALSFTAPLFVTLLAILFLGEKATTGRWLALFTGFIGTLTILHPDTGEFDARSLIVIATAMLWAVTGVLVKHLSRTESALSMVFYMNIIMLLFTLPVAAFHWAMPNLSQWGILTIIAICSLIMHSTMVRAYARAPLVTLMPFDFTRLIFTAAFAYVLFGEVSDAYTWLGAAIILASAVVSARRDVKASTPPV